MVEPSPIIDKDPLELCDIFAILEAAGARLEKDSYGWGRGVGTKILQAASLQNNILRHAPCTLAKANYVESSAFANLVAGCRDGAITY